MQKKQFSIQHRCSDYQLCSLRGTVSGRRNIRRMNKRPKKETVGAFEPSLLTLFYFECPFPFPSINAKNTEFAVSQHLRDDKSTLNEPRRMIRVENG